MSPSWRWAKCLEAAPSPGPSLEDPGQSTQHEKGKKIGCFESEIWKREDYQWNLWVLHSFAMQIVNHTSRRCFSDFIGRSFGSGKWSVYYSPRFIAWSLERLLKQTSTSQCIVLYILLMELLNILPWDTILRNLHILLMEEILHHLRCEIPCT